MGGNIPSKNFLGGNFPGGNFPRTIFFNETVIFLKIKLEKQNKSISANNISLILLFYLIHIRFFSSAEKVVAKTNQIR